MKSPKLIICVLILLLSGNACSQNIEDSITEAKLTKLAHINQSDSYISFPGDIGNLEPLIFEANINPNFVIREREDAKIILILTPQITIRMYDEYSHPVKTPSYIPQLSFYYLTGKGKSMQNLILFGRLAHHSNGQHGDFYIESKDGTSEINLETGDFYTNFFEFGFIKTSFGLKKNAVKFFKSSIEAHPRSWMNREMNGIYSGLRWNNSFIIYKLPWYSKSEFKKSSFSIKAETSWIIDSINDWQTFNLNRFNGALTFYYHPKFLEDIGFYIRFYHGRDYYNIYFDHRLDFIQLGLMTEILRF